MVEIEAKIRLKDLPRTREAVLNLGGRLDKERFREDNTLYDFSSGALEQKRCCLLYTSDAADE